MTGREADGGAGERPVLRLVTGPEPELVHSSGPDSRADAEPADETGAELDGEAGAELDDELLELILAGDDADGAGPDLDFLLVPLMVEAERQMRSVRRALDAEMWASELLGMLELGAPDGSTAEERAAVTLNLATRLVEYAVEQGTLSGLAMLRTLSVIGPAASRAEAADGAARMVEAGLHDRAWAASLGRPVVGRSWRFRDPDGSQESVTVVFGYGRREHALTVLIDHRLGGGVQDCWIGEDPDGVLAEARAALAGDGIEVEFIPAEQVRDTLRAALARPECPQTPEEVEDVAMCRALLQARVDLLVSTGSTPGTLEG